MKRMSYDIPAYKVGVIKIANGIEANYSKDDYSDAIEDRQAIIIPFEDLDGLEVEEVQKLLRIKEIMVQFFCQYTSFALNIRDEKTQTSYQSSYKDKLNSMKIENARRFMLYLYIDEETLEENKTTPIDQVIENVLEDFYNELTPDQKKCANCFFERYQDKSYQKTKQRIKRLEENNE